MVSFLQNESLGVDLMGHKINTRQILQNCEFIIQIGSTILHSPEGHEDLWP